ncbi:hypothetical protein PIB30_081486 [Stylosanthes scabra]|uniref:Uncharacterized protein n=1 Tax=Stylosanthes scabra TaxID=79078 RepID=A0ABU6UVG3_9FABA|nr:hypothetical protein [Stylosanthes scabra]
MREMEMQGIPVTMANLAIHRQKEEEMRQERMRYDQILQQAVAEKAREKNKGKARDVEEEDEDIDEGDSNGSEEWNEKKNSKSSPMSYACGAIVSRKEAWEVTEKCKRSKNEKMRKGAIVNGLEQTWTLWKEEFNTYNSHVELFD